VNAYLPHSDQDRAQMLAAVGATSVDDLFAALPESLRVAGLALPPGLTEAETRDHLQLLADENKVWGHSSFVGAGFYRHHVPAAVRAMIGRSEFATSYTPYQAEVSQGTLAHIFEFQTAVCELTGLDVANASLWDGPSAAAEAAFLALRATGRDRMALSGALHPETNQVISTYAAGPGFSITPLPVDETSGQTPPPLSGPPSDTGVVVLQQPNFFGVVEDTAAWAKAAHQAGALLVVVQNPVTLGVLEAPGVLGADIAVGDVQPLGNGLNFGGPSAGYMACRGSLLRQLPGRLVGRTVDAEGRTCYTLTLQAREQHIRRAKATSNICSNQALNALAATVYLALLGPVGLRELGSLCLQRAHALQERLKALPGVTAAFSGPFFHEFTLRLPFPANEFRRRLREQGVDPGIPLGRWFLEKDRELLVAVTEVNSPTGLDRYVEAAGRALTEGVAA